MEMITFTKLKQLKANNHQQKQIEYKLNQFSNDPDNRIYFNNYILGGRESIRLIVEQQVKNYLLATAIYPQR